MIAVLSTEEERLAALLRNDLQAYTHRVFRTVAPKATYLSNWHIGLMCEHLVALKDNKLGKNGLIINIPPRYMKSITVSVAFPSFVLGHDPQEQIICASYGQALAYEHSSNTRLVMETHWYQHAFPKTKISPRQNEKREFKTTEQGHRQATSVDAANVTGFGGNIQIMDDPHNPKQAQSDTERMAAIEWIRQVWSSRLNDKKTGKSILVMQRLHERDATGYLLAEQGEDYVHLEIPAVAEERTVIDFGSIHVVREKGDILHPEREGAKEIEKAKRNLGSYGYSGQYQQRPTPKGGGIIKKVWWRKWPHKDPPQCIAIFQSYDTAYTERHLEEEKKGEPSFSARTTWGIFEHRNKYEDDTRRPCIIMLEAWRDMIAYPDLRRETKQAYHDYIETSGIDGWLLIEKKASGQALVSDMRRAGLPVRTYIPKQFEDKVSRAHLTAPHFEAGMVYYIDRKWADEVIDEVAAFPNAQYTDWADTCTQAVLFIVRNQWTGLPDDEEDEDETEPAHEQKRIRSYG